MRFDSSPLAQVAGVVLLVGGILFGLVALMMFLFSTLTPEFMAEYDPIYLEIGSAAGTILAGLGVVFLLIAIVSVVAAIGVFAHKTWARWTGIVMAVIGLLLGLFIVLMGFEPPQDMGLAIFGVIVAGAHGVAAAGLAAGGHHFRPIYPSG